MVYLDTSVALAHLMAEDRLPDDALWDEPLVSSRLLEYEIWTRLHARQLSATHGLIGLGPGLTPSGDDLVAGLAIALSATGEADAAAALAVFVRGAPADATSALSRAFLDAAIAGLPTAALHAAIAALINGDEAALAAAVDRLDGVGHTSGWDMLAGAVLGLRAVTHRRSDASIQ